MFPDYFVYSFNNLNALSMRRFQTQLKVQILRQMRSNSRSISMDECKYWIVIGFEGCGSFKHLEFGRGVEMNAFLRVKKCFLRRPVACRSHWPVVGCEILGQ